MAIFMKTIIADEKPPTHASDLEELAPLRWLWQRVGFTTVELENR